MKTSSRDRLRSIGLVGVVVGVSVFGHLRDGTSQVLFPKDTVGADVRGPETSAFTISDATDAQVIAVGASAFRARKAIDATDDKTILIPALFALDPDVRFVYDRHVSKWM